MEAFGLLVPALFALAGFVQGRSGWAIGGALLAFVYLTLSSESWLVIALVSLVALLGVIVSRYSEQYLSGEPNQGLFYRWLNWVLGFVMLVLTTDHLLVFWLGWIGISLSMHQLLLFYPDRPRARLAAHKKFIFGRIADLCFLSAIALLYWNYQTFSIDMLANLVASQPITPLTHVAASLLVLTALLKCAQMPFHGWIIQVVESPTPVSALLHAGVVNLGGFLLLSHTALLQASWVATMLLAVAAGATLIMAALIATTRISVKVGLAWSTVAQMALMLLQIAAGLYALAALHIIAHSCYKAFSFLNAGSQVKSAVNRKIAPHERSWGTAMGGTALGLTTYLGLTFFAAHSLTLTELTFYALYSAGFAALVTKTSLVLGLCSVVLLSSVHWTLKLQLGWSALPESVLVELLFATIILSFLALSWLVQFSEGRPLGRRIHQALFAGLYLDEWSTRVTLSLWPTPLKQPSKRPVRFIEVSS